MVRPKILTTLCGFDNSCGYPSLPAALANSVLVWDGLQLEKLLKGPCKLIPTPNEKGCIFIAISGCQKNQEFIATNLSQLNRPFRSIFHFPVAMTDDTKNHDTKNQDVAALDKIPAKAPKMPHVMKKVYSQVRKHPRFKELHESTRFAFNIARGGYSYRTKENNAWIRKLWKHLYLDEPMPE